MGRETEALMAGDGGSYRKNDRSSTLLEEPDHNIAENHLLEGTNTESKDEQNQTNN